MHQKSASVDHLSALSGLMAVKNAGKGRFQENDVPDLSDLDPQFNLMSAPSSFLGSGSRAAPRTFASMPAPRREQTDKKDEPKDLVSDLDSAPRKIPSTSDSSLDADQQALIKQIRSQSEALEALRVQIIHNLQIADDSLYDDADQVARPVIRTRTP